MRPCWIGIHISDAHSVVSIVMCIFVWFTGASLLNLHSLHCTYFAECKVCSKYQHQPTPFKNSYRIELSIFQSFAWTCLLGLISELCYEPTYILPGDTLWWCVGLNLLENGQRGRQITMHSRIVMVMGMIMVMVMMSLMMVMIRMVRGAARLLCILELWSNIGRQILYTLVCNNDDNDDDFKRRFQ